LGGVYLVKLHGNRCPDYEVGSLESHLNVNVAAVVPDPTFRIHNVQAHWSEEKAFLSPNCVKKQLSREKLESHFIKTPSYTSHLKSNATKP